MNFLHIINQYFKESNKFKEVKEASFDFLYETSVHGIKKILNSKRSIVQLLWSVCLLVSVCGCSFFTVKLIMDYSRFEVITKINMVHEQPMEFPAVSICSEQNALKRAQEKFYDFLLNCQFNYDQNYCWYNSKKVLFEPFTDKFLGTCFSFNIGRNFSHFPSSVLKSLRSGVHSGLKLDFYVNLIKDMNSLRIQIHNRTFKPTFISDLGIGISPGKINYFEISKIITQNLEYPYNDCLKDVNTFTLNKTLIDFILKANKSYSQKECLDLCFSLIYLEKSDCKCSAPLDLVYATCFFSNQTSNCSRIYESNSDKNEKRQQCVQYCPLECDSIAFPIVSSSFIELPWNRSNINMYYGNNLKSYFDVRKKYFSVRIYFKDLKYTLISQEPKLLFGKLIANIGGIFGVFIGCSFLSFVEPIEYFLKCLFIILNAKKTNIVVPI